MVTDGPAKKIYHDKINFVKQRGSKEGLDKLLEMCTDYENGYENGFNIFLLENFVKC